MLDTNMGLTVESRLNRRMVTSGLGAIWHVSLTNPSLRATAEHRHACMVDEKFKLIRDLARARFSLDSRRGHPLTLGQLHPEIDAQIVRVKQENSSWTWVIGYQDWLHMRHRKMYYYSTHAPKRRQARV